MISLEPFLVGARVAGLLGAATGLVLLAVPRRFLEAPNGLRRVLLEADIGALFNRRISLERSFYRMHRLFGFGVLAGAIAAGSFTWYLASVPRALKLQRVLGRLGYDFIEAVAALLAVVLLVVGLCLILRPSVLKGLEAVMNRWVEMPAKGRSHAAISRAILRAPRVAGLLLLAAGVVCLRPF